VRRRVELVFKFPYKLKKESYELAHPFSRMPANLNTVVRYFPTDPLNTIFLNFIKDNFYGVFICENGNWVAYGWMSRPSTPGPIHLSPAIQKLKVFWIFYCHTKESFRGRGLYKTVLRILIQQAFHENKEAEIYMDTQLDNIPARKAILTVGFKPQGTVYTYKFGIPKIKIWNWCKWNKEAVHLTLID